MPVISEQAYSLCQSIEQPREDLLFCGYIICLSLSILDFQGSKVLLDTSDHISILFNQIRLE